MLYYLNETAAVFSKPQGNDLYEVEVLMGNSRHVLRYELSEASLNLILGFSEPASIEEMSKKFRLKISDIETFIEVFIDDCVLVSLCDAVNVDQDGLYSRQMNFLSGFASSIEKVNTWQQNLQNSNVVILGLGGIGSWVATQLSMMGVRNLTLIDPDTVSKTNLSHQAYFDPADIGRSKAQVLADRFANLDADFNTTVVHQKVCKAEQLCDYLDKVDILINCADEPSVEETNDLVTKVCFSTNTKHILCGGYDGHETSIGQTVIPYETSCWRCYIEGGVYETLMRGFTNHSISVSQKKGAVIAPTANITASITALEAVKVICDYQAPNMINAKGEFSFANMEMSQIEIPIFNDCSQCSGGK